MKTQGDERLFLLDTNVLMHDPAALFQFGQNDIFIPMVVLEELDHAKTGVSELARNVRQVSRTLDDLIDGASHDQIAAGVQLEHSGASSGRVFFQTPGSLDDAAPGRSPANGILSTAMALQRARPTTSIVIVSKDINLRIKAQVMGIRAEDYFDDKELADVSRLYDGLRELPADFLSLQGDSMNTWSEAGRTFHRFSGPSVTEWLPGQCLHAGDDNGFEAIVRDRAHQKTTVVEASDYRPRGNEVWGVRARNREQNFALNLLMDPDIDFVSLLGTAGAGKTLLTLAAGLAQTLEAKRYREIVMTRVTVSVGEDIGYLPGTEEEKMAPWMGALSDNLEVLTDFEVGGEWGRAASKELLHSRIKIRSLSFMRGRTFLNRYVIIDEAQNLTRKQMKTLITRAGPGTKMICLGNVAQIDTPYLSETTSGLAYVVDRFKSWSHSGHVTLRRGERSRLADYATESL